MDYKEHNCNCGSCAPQPGQKAPSFESDAFYNGETQKIKLEDYKGKWVVLFFYPADFTFVCPTELGDLADNYEKFQELNTEILSVSTDTAFVHKAWHEDSDTIKKIKFPMLADPTAKICQAYGVYLADEGLALRGTFVIDPDGMLQAMTVNADGIGRSTPELLRTLQAAQFVKEHGGKVCPVNWQPGGKTLQPGMDLVGKI